VLSTDLNVLDELYLHLDRDDEPWSVHLEVGLDGRVDSERLRDAIARAARAHPLARARLRKALPTDVRYHWELGDELDEVPLEVVECADDAALERAREQLMSHSPSLENPPPFAVTLAHHPDGDSVLLNLSHAAGDGISAARLMTSFLRAYAGEEDPPAPVDPLEVREIGPLVQSRSLTARLARGRRYGDTDHLAGREAGARHSHDAPTRDDGRCDDDSRPRDGRGRGRRETGPVCGRWCTGGGGG